MAGADRLLGEHVVHDVGSFVRSTEAGFGVGTWCARQCARAGERARARKGVRAPVCGRSCAWGGSERP